MVPIATAFRSAPSGSPRRAAQHLLLWIGDRHRDHARRQPRRTADQQRARRHVGAARFLVAAVGVVVAGAELHRPAMGRLRGCTRSGGWRSPRAPRSSWQRSAARAPASGGLVRRSTRLTASLLHGSDHGAVAAGRQSRGRAIDLSARSRLAALDGFDARARPASIVYDPLRKGRRRPGTPKVRLAVKPAAALAAGPRDPQRPLLLPAMFLRLLVQHLANAGQVSPGYSAPWAAPGVPAKALKWLFQRHSPLAIKPDFTLWQLQWTMQLLRNCTTARYSINKERMVRLAEYSRDCLDELRASTGIAYEGRTQGTLQVFRTQKQLRC